MNILSFVGRIGRDAEVRDANGTAVANIAVAYNYGRKDNDGKRPSQWVDAALWGNRADGLAPYLLKGQQVAITLRDVYVHTYAKNDGTTGSSLRGDVLEITLVGDAPQQNQQQGRAQPARQPAPQQRQAPARQPAARQPAAAGGSGFDDMDDDIPF
jgi:single-strand DNA-binding protein